MRILYSQNKAYALGRQILGLAQQYVGKVLQKGALQRHDHRVQHVRQSPARHTKRFFY